MGVIQYMGILPGQRFDGVGGEPRRLFPVSVQRVAGQVQAADFFFLLKQLCMAVLRECFDLITVGIFASSGVQTASSAAPRPRVTTLQRWISCPP